MPKTQLNAFKSMFLIRISNNLLIYKVDQINQISIPQSISARSFLPFFFRNIFPHYLFITCCFRRRSSAKVPNFPLWPSRSYKHSSYQYNSLCIFICVCLVLSKTTIKLYSQKQLLLKNNYNSICIFIIVCLALLKTF